MRRCCRRLSPQHALRLNIFDLGRGGRMASKRGSGSSSGEVAGRTLMGQKGMEGGTLGRRRRRRI